MALQERRDFTGIRGLTNECRDVDGEEIAGGEVAIDGFERDVVRVNVIGPSPSQCLDGGIGGLADANSVPSR